jgi:hypothetical protein
VDASLLESEEKSEGGAAAGGAPSPPPGTKVPLPLNSNDKLYSEIRDFHINSVGPKLRERAMDLQSQEAKKEDAGTLEDIHDFVKAIPELQADKSALSHQINITELLNKTVDDHTFMKRWEIEQAILQGEGQQANVDYIEERVARQDPLLQVREWETGVRRAGGKEGRGGLSCLITAVSRPSR